MKLTARIIIKKLEEKYTVTHSTELSNHPCLGRPLFYTGNEEALKNRLYIVTGVTFCAQTDLPKTSLFIALNSKNSGDAPMPSNLCYVSNQTDASELFNDLQSIFDDFEQWNDSLIQSRLEEESIYSMLHMSTSIFRNSLVVVGMDFSVISKAGDTRGLFEEAVFGSTDETYKLINSLKKDELYNNVREHDGVFMFPKHITGCASLCVNIKKHGLTTHRLMILETDTPLDEDYGFLLEILGSMIGYSLSHQKTNVTEKDKSLHSVLKTIITDRTADYVTTSQRLDNLGWYSRNEYQCITFQITSLDQRNLTENAICNYVENAIPHSCAFPHREYIVIYINLTKARMTVADISERLIYFIRDSYFKAGYSRSMVGHFNLRRQYLQALIALDLGSKKEPSIWTHRFNDVAFDYILEQATRKLPGYMISHEKLLRLKDADEFQHTDYMNTLKLYLDNHLNAVKTAKDLFIHRSTFLYRLEKIKSLLDTTLEDPEEVLYLMLSFRLIELEEKDEKAVLSTLKQK